MRVPKIIKKSDGDGNGETLIIKNTQSKQSLNVGEPQDRDFPTAPWFDNSYPYNRGNHFKNKPEPTWQQSLGMHPVTPLVQDLSNLSAEIEKTLYIQHLDPSTPFQKPPVLVLGNTKIDVNKDNRSSTQVSSAHTSGLFIAVGFGVGCLLLLLLIAFAAFRKKNTRPGTGLRTGVVGAGAVQQHPKSDMRPPGQGGPRPESNDLPPPYSECINMPLSEDRGPFLTDTELLAHNNHLLGTCFSNKCVAMTTAPNTFGDHKTEFVFDNGRIVERLSVDEIGHGTRRADGRDNVVYVDEHSKAVL